MVAHGRANTPRDDVMFHVDSTKLANGSVQVIRGNHAQSSVRTGTSRSLTTASGKKMSEGNAKGKMKGKPTAMVRKNFEAAGTLEKSSGGQGKGNAKPKPVSTHPASPEPLSRERSLSKNLKPKPMSRSQGRKTDGSSERRSPERVTMRDRDRSPDRRGRSPDRRGKSPERRTKDCSLERRPPESFTIRDRSPDRSLKRRPPERVTKREQSPGRRSRSDHRGNSPERRNKSPERRNKSTEPQSRRKERRDSLVSAPGKMGSGGGNIFFEQIPAPQPRSTALWPTSSASFQPNSNNSDLSWRASRSRTHVRDTVSPTPAIELVAVQNPDGKLKTGILTPRIKTLPTHVDSEPRLPSKPIPKFLPEGKKMSELLSCPPKFRHQATIDKNSSFYRECINLEFSNSIVASESTMAPPDISKQNSNEKSKKNDNEASKKIGATFSTRDGNQMAGVLSMGKDAWQEVVAATKVLDANFDAIKESRRKPINVPEKTLQEINTAVATIKKHAAILGVQDHELVAAVKGWGTNKPTEAKDTKDAKPGTSTRQENTNPKQKTWIDMIDFRICSPLEPTCADVLGEDKDYALNHDEFITYQGRYFLDGRELASF